MADFTIFWYWQMDAPLAINKDFIQQALNAAVQELGNQFDIEEADRVTGESRAKTVCLTLRAASPVRSIVAA